MTPISLDHTFTVSKDAVFRDLEGEAVILDLGSGETMTYTLVFPSQANVDDGKISVLARGR